MRLILERVKERELEDTLRKEKVKRRRRELLSRILVYLVHVGWFIPPLYMYFTTPFPEVKLLALILIAVPAVLVPLSILDIELNREDEEDAN